MRFIIVTKCCFVLVLLLHIAQRHSFLAENNSGKLLYAMTHDADLVLLQLPAASARITLLCVVCMSMLHAVFKWCGQTAPATVTVTLALSVRYITLHPFIWRDDVLSTGHTVLLLNWIRCRLNVALVQCKFSTRKLLLQQYWAAATVSFC